ncbi:MAG: MIP/aquaporin family protein [Desulfurococcaceae archaeon]
MGNLYLGEFIGTMILILLGDGVVANVVLEKSKGHGGGWIVITTGWAMAVVFGVGAAILAGSPYAFINPAVAIALVAAGQVPLSAAEVIGCIIAEILGAFVGAVLVFLAYYSHFAETKDPTPKLGTFSTIPQIRNLGLNMLTEIIGTFMLVFGVMVISKGIQPPAGLAPVLVGLLVLSIGLSLGGPTGYAINPARDLGPRLAHAILPIPGKGSSDWSYGLTVPIIGPIIGGLLGAFVALAVL